jgi:hypothetical protein
VRSSNATVVRRGVRTPSGAWSRKKSTNSVRQKLPRSKRSHSCHRCSSSRRRRSRRRSESACRDRRSDYSKWCGDHRFPADRAKRRHSAKDTVQGALIVNTGNATRLVRKKRLDGGPFKVREFIPHDSGPRFGRLNHNQTDAFNRRSGHSAVPRLQPTCYGHTEIDANDPSRSSTKALPLPV